MEENGEAGTKEGNNTFIEHIHEQGTYQYIINIHTTL